MAKTAAQNLPADKLVTEQNFNKGLVRDNDPPVGGLQDVQDWLIEQPGRIYKRGAWERHSDSNGGCAGMRWVGTIEHPTRVVAIGDDLSLYDVTSENSPTSSTIGSVGFYPHENPSLYKGSLILCEPLAASAPKKVYFDPVDDTIKVDDLEGSPPAAAYSTVYSGLLVLGGGPLDETSHTAISDQQRLLWFAPTDADINSDPPQTDWNTTKSVWVTSAPVTGLASIGGVMLIFHSNSVERMLGTVPPGLDHVGVDFQMQPFASVGCLDARSIVYGDEGVIFAGEEGVWWTNGSGLTSLTQHDDNNGIQSFWRSLFPRHHEAGEHNFRQLIGGVINRDFYLICVLDEDNVTVETLLCHVPTKAWTRLTNVNAISMAHGFDEQGIGELYMASAIEPYVNRAVPMVYPAQRNMADPSGTGPNPTFTSRNIGGDSPGLKAYGFGWVSYQITDPDGLSPSLSAQVLTNLHATGTNSEAQAFPISTLNRKRVSINVDTQAAWWKVTQTGTSETTEIYYLEAEQRLYPSAADSLGR